MSSRKRSIAACPGPSAAGRTLGGIGGWLWGDNDRNYHSCYHSVVKGGVGGPWSGDSSGTVTMQKAGAGVMGGCSGEAGI